MAEVVALQIDDRPLDHVVKVKSVCARMRTNQPYVQPRMLDQRHVMMHAVASPITETTCDNAAALWRHAINIVQLFKAQ